jgi:phytol kinase
MGVGVPPAWLTATLVGALLALLYWVVSVLKRRTRLSAEGARKLFHISGGAVALALPWLFDTVWPVISLGAASVGAFALLRTIPALRQGTGQTLQGVARETSGEFWFVVGTVTIFAITAGDVVSYSIGILVLAVADTAAAMVGVFYGRHRFDLTRGFKSAEGSAAFLLIAFLCVHVPLLLFSEVGRAESLLIALNMSLVLMLAEAGAGRGSDNFVLPVLVVVLLSAYRDSTVVGLLRDLGIIAALSLLVFEFRKRTTLSTDALVVAVLAGYIFWLFGDFRWLVAPLVVFASYTWLTGRPRITQFERFHAEVVLALVAPSVILVTINALAGNGVLYAMHVAACAANLAIVGALHQQLDDPAVTLRQTFVVNIVKSLAVLVPGLAVAERYDLAEFLAALLAVPIALLLFALLGKPLLQAPTQVAGWRRVSLSVGSALLLAFGLALALQGRVP